MFNKRKYIGPLFEKKPNTINDDRSRENKALDYRDMVNQEMDPANLIEDASRPKKKGSNATVVVFIILLVIVGNLFPSAFRGVQFFFVATLLFFVSFFIAAKFEK